MNPRQSFAKPPSPHPSAPKLLFPFLDLKAEYATMKEEIGTAVEKVLESQQFIMGPEVRQLEAEIAAFVGSRFALGCASGSDALLLALMALGVDSGDEVITPPFTFVATAGSISRLKARPVFVDIDRETYNLDPARLEAAITSRTKAIMPVHLFGLAAEMEKIKNRARPPPAGDRRCGPGDRRPLPRPVCRQPRRLRLLQLFSLKKSWRGRRRWNDHDL